MKVLKKLGTGLAVAALTGLLAGGLSRVLMRLITIVGGGEPGFTLSGTVFITLIHVIAAAPVALMAAFTTQRWRWVAGAVGALLLALPAASITAAELGDTTGWTSAQWVGALTLSAAVFATIFVLPVVAVRLVDRTQGRMRAHHTVVSMAAE